MFVQIIAIAIAQSALQQLARGRVWQFVDEDIGVGKLPFRKSFGEKLVQFLGLWLRFVGDDDRNGPLFPFRMLSGNHRGLSDARITDDRIFQVHRADPFAATLDQILRAVNDAQVAVLIHGDHVARAQPAIFSPLVV